MKLIKRVSNIFKSIKNALLNLSNKINNVKHNFLFKYPFFNRLSILVSMQINNSKSLSKKKANKVITALLQVVLFVALIFVFKFAIKYFQQFTMVPFNYDLLGTIVLVFIALSVLEIANDFVTYLYRGIDNPILLSYPVKPSEVFASKVIVKFINQLKKIFFFITPLLIGFYLERGFVYSITWVYFIKLIYVIFIIPTFVVSLSAIISIVLVVIDYLVRKFAFIKYILLLAIYTIVSILVISLVNSLPINLPLLNLWYEITQNVISFLSTLINSTLFTNSVLYFLFGFDTWLNLLYTILITSGLVVLTILLGFPLFFKLSSSSSEFSSSKVHKTKMKKTNSIFLVFFKKEFKNYFRSDDKVLGTFMYLLILPVLIYCLNRIFYSLNISATGKMLIFCINILISITLLTSSNISSASALSREGNEFYLLKISPVDTRLICIAKILLNFVLSSLAIIMVGISLSAARMLETSDVIFICIILFFVNTGHICWSFELDILNPKIAQYAAGEEIVNNNSNVNKSIIIGLILAVLFTIISYFFYMRYNEGVIIGPVKVILIAVAFCIARIYLFITKMRAYFNDMAL